MLTHHLELLGAGSFLRSPVGNITGGKVPAARDNEDGDEDEDDVAQELEERDDGNAKTFQRWILLLISHWSAADILSRFSANQGTEGAAIILIHARSNRNRTRMERWDATIRRLAYLPAADGPTDPLNAETAIALFTQKVQDPNLNAKIVKAFRKQGKDGVYEALPSDEVMFCGNIHCEAALGDAYEIQYGFENRKLINSPHAGAHSYISIVIY